MCGVLICILISFSPPFPFLRRFPDKSGQAPPSQGPYFYSGYGVALRSRISDERSGVQPRKINNRVFEVPDNVFPVLSLSFEDISYNFVVLRGSFDVPNKDFVVSYVSLEPLNNKFVVSNKDFDVQNKKFLVLTKNYGHPDKDSALRNSDQA